MPSTKHNEGMFSAYVRAALLLEYMRLLTPFQKFFTSKEQGLVTNDRNLHLISKYRTDMLVRLVLTLTTVGLLIGPSAVLFTVPGHATLKIVLIMVFTLLFSIAIGVATKAKRHEMLAATAT